MWIPCPVPRGHLFFNVNKIFIQKSICRSYLAAIYYVGVFILSIMFFLCTLGPSTKIFVQNLLIYAKKPHDWY